MLEIERHTTPDALNEVLNHPRVRPWVASGSEVLNVSAAVANPKNILLMGEHGGCMFFYMQEGVYEVHTQVLPQGRGEWVSALTEACARWIFTRTPCYEVVTRVPEGHLAAKVAAIARGMRFEFTRQKECQFRGQLVDVSLYSWRIQDWIAQADALEELGQRFHEMLHAAAIKHGVKDPEHADDPNHNRYVGAAIEMGLYGHIVKGVLWYNRWAYMARHAPIILLQRENPAIIKIDHGFLLHIQDGQLEVHYAQS